MIIFVLIATGESHNYDTTTPSRRCTGGNPLKGCMNYVPGWGGEGWGGGLGGGGV